jgi:hypothetical protein
VDAPTLINYLADFYTAAEIRAQRKEIGDALLSKVALPIVINQRSREGSSSGGISLATNDECTHFMKCCEAAEKRLNQDTSVDPAGLGTGVNFSFRPVQA